MNYVYFSLVNFYLLVSFYLVIDLLIDLVIDSSIGEWKTLIETIDLVYDATYVH